MARAHQNLIWDRTRHTNRLRNDLREFFPAALVAFDDLSHPDAVAVLAKAPTLNKPRNSPCAGPLTIASGRKHAVLARHVRNQRLHDAIDQWAFSSLQASPGSGAFYDQRRTAGDLHHQALRALGDRLVGYLHGSLRTRQPYNEHTAWAHRNQEILIAA